MQAQQVMADWLAHSCRGVCALEFLSSQLMLGVLELEGALEPNQSSPLMDEVK